MNRETVEAILLLTSGLGCFVFTYLAFTLPDESWAASVMPLLAGACVSVITLIYIRWRAAAELRAKGVQP
jgi:uncharacterized membrane protein YhhN